MINPPKHEIDYIRALEKLGYTASYTCESGKITNLENKKEYGPGDLKLVEEFRFEGMSNPSDNSILYVIEGKDGSKGTTLVAYGPNGDDCFAWFFKKVPEECMCEFDKSKLEGIKTA